jgi:uncharacterized membrane protein
MRKTLSFALVHMSVAFCVGYAFTGSVWAGGALALVEPALNTLAYHWHERLWRRIDQRQAELAERTAASTARPIAA